MQKKKSLLLFLILYFLSFFTETTLGAKTIKKAQGFFLYKNYFITDYDSSMNHNFILLETETGETPFFLIFEDPFLNFSIYHNIQQTPHSDFPKRSEIESLKIGMEVFIQKEKAILSEKISHCFSNYPYSCYKVNKNFKKSLKTSPVLDRYYNVIGFYLEKDRQGFIFSIQHIYDIIQKFTAPLEVNIKNPKVHYSLIKENLAYSFQGDLKLSKISDIHVDKKGNFYVLDSIHKSLYKMSLDKFILKKKERALLYFNKSFINPSSFTLYKDEFIYILDAEQKLIFILNKDLKLIESISFRKLDPSISFQKIFYIQNFFILITKNLKVYLMKKDKDSLFKVTELKSSFFKVLDIFYHDNFILSLEKKEEDYFIRKIKVNENLKWQGSLYKLPKKSLKSPEQIYYKNSNIYLYDLKRKESMAFHLNHLKEGLSLKLKEQPSPDKTYGILKKVQFYKDWLIKAYDKNHGLSFINLKKIYGKENKALKNQKAPQFFINNLKAPISFKLGEKNLLLNKCFDFDIKDKILSLFCLLGNQSNKYKTLVFENHGQSDSLSKDGLSSQEEDSLKKENLNNFLISIKEHQDWVLLKDFSTKNKKFLIKYYPSQGKLFFYNNGFKKEIFIKEIEKNIIIQDIKKRGEKIFLLDEAHSKVFILNEEGKIISYFYVRNKDKKTLRSFQDFVLNPNESEDEIFILSKNQIYTFNFKGEMQNFFSLKEESKALKFAYFDSYFYVLDEKSKRISKYEKTGTFVSFIEYQEFKINRKIHPKKLKLIDNHLYILEDNNYNVFKISNP